VKRRMLCTFSDTNNVEKLCDKLHNELNVESDIFIFSTDKRHEKILTYVVGDLEQFPSRTIMIHRKGKTNTLYTINAINEIIKRRNNGILDTSMQLDWSLYQDTLLLFKNDEIIRVAITLEEKIFPEFNN